MCPASPQSITRFAMLSPAPARLALSFTSTTPLTGPLWIPIRSCRRGCSLSARLISTAHCAGASGLRVKDQHHPVASWDPNQTVRGFGSLKLFGGANNPVQFLNRRVLVVNRKLRVANDVDEQDMGDFELDLFLISMGILSGALRLMNFIMRLSQMVEIVSDDFPVIYTRRILRFCADTAGEKSHKHTIVGYVLSNGLCGRKFSMIGHSLKDQKSMAGESTFKATMLGFMSDEQEQSTTETPFLLWHFSPGDKIENCSAQFLAVCWIVRVEFKVHRLRDGFSVSNALLLGQSLPAFIGHNLDKIGDGTVL